MGDSNRPKHPQITLQMPFFIDPKFTFHVLKSHKILGWVGFKDLGKFSQKKDTFFGEVFFGAFPKSADQDVLLARLDKI